MVVNPPIPVSRETRSAAPMAVLFCKFQEVYDFSLHSLLLEVSLCNSLYWLLSERLGLLLFRCR